jgi:hypothetical protein
MVTRDALESQPNAVHPTRVMILPADFRNLNCGNRPARPAHLQGGIHG